MIPAEIKRRRYLGFAATVKDAFHPAVKVVEVPHHLAHAVAVYHQSEFDDTAILVADGIAEYDTLWAGMATDYAFNVHKTIAFPHSFGMTYAALTDLLGFRPFHDEWKVMGMAAYGRPRYYEEINDLMTVTHDLDVTVDQTVFTFACGGQHDLVAAGSFLASFRRKPDEELSERHFDVARSFQAVFEDKLLSVCKLVKAAYPALDSMCLSGGVFYNCLFNGRLARERTFERVYVDCDPSDAGSALGAACWAYREATGTAPRRLNHDNRLGRSFPAGRVAEAVAQSGLRSRQWSDPDDIAQAMVQHRTIGFFQGRAEFGARALGARSILADPRDARVKADINAKVKYRESFRPFAPTVLYDRQEEYFATSVFSPYMSFAVRARPGTEARIPAVIHADRTARIQSLTRDQDPFYYSVVQAVERLTGIPVVLNTSFNIRGEPVVYSPEDALDTFERSGLDVMALGPFLVYKN